MTMRAACLELAPLRNSDSNSNPIREGYSADNDSAARLDVLPQLVDSLSG